MAYQRYADDIEVPYPNEEQLAHDIVDQMARSQLAAAGRHRHAHRDAHAKSHGLLVGTLRVHDNLPDELAQGVFAHAGQYPVVARLSSAPGDIRTDETPAPRGFALKVMGVEGDRLNEDRPEPNQDFLLVNLPVLAFGTIEKYKEMLGLLESNAKRPIAVQKGIAATARTVQKAVSGLNKEPSATLQGLARDHAHPLGESYHSQGALRYGDYVAKLSLVPVGPVASLTGTQVDPDFDSMRASVETYMRSNPATYELRVQLCTNVDDMPVEDAAVLWDPEVSPHRTVATLTFEPQNLNSPARRVYGDDRLSYDPWNGVVEHRPLGSIMRVRKLAYSNSAQMRQRLNAVERSEPTSTDDIPA